MGADLWGERVVTQLSSFWAGWPVVVLAGELYVEALRRGAEAFRRPVPRDFHDPLKGLQVGQRLAWFKRERAGEAA